MFKKYLLKVIKFLGGGFCMISLLGLIAWMQASDPDCILAHTGALLEQRLCAEEYAGESPQPSYLYLIAIVGAFSLGLLLYRVGSRVDVNKS